MELQATLFKCACSKSHITASVDTFSECVCGRKLYPQMRDVARAQLNAKLEQQGRLFK